MLTTSKKGVSRKSRLQFEKQLQYYSIARPRHKIHFISRNNLNFEKSDKRHILEGINFDDMKKYCFFQISRPEYPINLSWIQYFLLFGKPENQTTSTLMPKKPKWKSIMNRTVFTRLRVPSWYQHQSLLRNYRNSLIEHNTK